MFAQEMVVKISLHNYHVSWTKISKNTQSFAIVYKDIENELKTRSFIHWIVFNIPASVNHLKENEIQGILGTNSYGKFGYNGPCPPQEKAHNYVFKVYALDTMLNLGKGVTKQELEKAIFEHTLDSSKLTGKYSSKDEY
jgi:Raf kinase inhibitor-like YbhB/YbcL family protein